MNSLLLLGSFIVSFLIVMGFIEYAANYIPEEAITTEPQEKKREEVKVEPPKKEEQQPPMQTIPDWVKRQAQQASQPQKPPTLAPTAPKPTPTAPTTAQWMTDIFTKNDEHLAIVGASGDGKTTLVKALFTRALENGYQLVLIDPHNIDSNWGITTCMQGPKYEQAIQAIEFVYQEFVKRMGTPEKDHPRQKLLVCIDEWPSIQQKCPTLKDKVVEMILQARKYQIRLLILTQSINVKDMGLEGSGPIRESLIKVILKSFSTPLLEKAKLSVKGNYPVALLVKGKLLSETAKEALTIANSLKQENHWQPVLDYIKECSEEEPTKEEAKEEAKEETNTKETETKEEDINE